MSGNRNQGGKWISRATRHRIYVRDNHRCVWCGRDIIRGNAQSPERDRIATLDHVIARADGGTNSPQNLVTACARCNRIRQGYHVAGFLDTMTPGDAFAATNRLVYAMTTPLPKKESKCSTSTINCAA